MRQVWEASALLFTACHSRFDRSFVNGQKAFCEDDFRQYAKKAFW
jgi:hypothetical protein